MKAYGAAIKKELELTEAGKRLAEEIKQNPLLRPYLEVE